MAKESTALQRRRNAASLPSVCRSGRWFAAGIRRRKPGFPESLAAIQRQRFCAPQFVFAAALAGAAVVTNSVASNIAWPSGVGIVTR